MLRKSDIEYIQNLDLLEPGETIYKFYSEFKKDKAGNFFTNRRIAMYWIDDRHNKKSEISFAFYPDIKSIDTIYNPGASYCPYMLVTRLDSTQFKVCANGNRKEVEYFFEEAMQLWIENRGQTHMHCRRPQSSAVANWRNALILVIRIINLDE
jgi:hypothetical protein